jgi:hypothetical protein
LFFPSFPSRIETAFDLMILEICFRFTFFISKTGTNYFFDPEFPAFLLAVAP